MAGIHTRPTIGKLQDPSKDLREQDNFVTGQKIGSNRRALDTLQVGVTNFNPQDVIEAGSDNNLVMLTAHGAREGDFLRLETIADANVKEFEVVIDQIINANSFRLGTILSGSLTAGDIVSILRPITPTMGADGATLATLTPSPVKFIKDGVTIDVEEDTVTPANNNPLPVKLIGVTGDITITAQQLDVQSSHIGANADSMRIGDGNETANVTANNELNVHDEDALQELQDINTALGIGIPVTGPLTDAELRATPVPVSGPLTDAQLRAADVGVAVSNFPASQTVDGTVNIGNFPAVQDVDVVSSVLPSGASTAAKQDDIITELTTLNANDFATEAKQDTGNASLSSIDTKLSSQATAAKQDIGNASLASIDADTGSIDSKLNNDYGLASGALRTASQIGNASGVADFNDGASGAQTLRVSANIQRDGNDLDYNSGAASGNTLRSVLATRHEAAATPLSQRESDGTDFLSSIALAASQLTSGALTKLKACMSVMMGWDGTTHRELSVDNTGKLNVNATVSSSTAETEPDAVDYVLNTLTVPANKVAEAKIKSVHGQVKLNGEVILSNYRTFEGVNDLVTGKVGDAIDTSGSFTSGTVLTQRLSITASGVYSIYYNPTSFSASTIETYIARNNVAVTDATNAATGRMIVTSVSGYAVGQLVVLDDDDSAENQYYVIAINGGTNELTLSTTFNGAAASLTAYSVAQNAHIFRVIGYNTSATWTAGTEKLLFQNYYLLAGDTLWVHKTVTNAGQFLFAIPGQSSVTELDIKLKDSDAITTVLPSGMGITEIWYSQYPV